jgi:hypothetical protein
MARGNSLGNASGATGVTALGSIFPNPSSREMTVPYTLASQGVVNIYVTNMFGQRVMSIVSNQDMMPGNYQGTFNVSGLSSGVYFYTMETQGYRATKKLIIAKD